MALNNLLVQLGLNTAAYEAGLNRSKGLAGKFAGDLKTQLAGAFTVGAAVNFFRSIQVGVERMKDLSEQFNVSTDDVQRFDYHAKRNGLTMEAFAAGLGRLANLRRDAAKGDKDAVATLNEFGISLKQATDPAFTMADVIDSVSKSINEFGLNTERTAMITDIFGRAGQRLISTLKEISGTPKMSLVDEKDVKAIDDLSKRWGVFWMQIKANWTKTIADTIRGEGNLLGFGPSKKQLAAMPVSEVGGAIGSMPGGPKVSPLTGPSFIGDLNREGKLDSRADQQRARLIRIGEQNQRTLEKIAEKGQIGQATYF